MRFAAAEPGEPYAAPPAAPAAPSGEGSDCVVGGAGSSGGCSRCAVLCCGCRGCAHRASPGASPAAQRPSPCPAAASTNGSHLFCFLSLFSAACAAVPLYLCSCLSLSECLSSSAFRSRVPADHRPAAQGEHSAGGRVPSRRWVLRCVPALRGSRRRSPGLTGAHRVHALLRSGLSRGTTRWDRARPGTVLLPEPCPGRRVAALRCAPLRALPVCSSHRAAAGR